MFGKFTYPPLSSLLRGSRKMPDIEFIGGEIERMRLQALRHRRVIMQLQRAGISSTSAEALLDRMLIKIDQLCAERDKLKNELPSRALRGRPW